MKNLFQKLCLLVATLAVGFNAVAQKVEVSGTVKDKNGVLPGVSVIIEGTSTGVVTDAQGHYSIEVPAKATLVFSFLGYEEQRIECGTRTRIDVVLEENATQIEELVVVGYGYQRKSDLATSVTSVKADELKSYPSGNVADMLRGRAAGVNVTSSSGRPGSLPDITIRGNRSISASNTPLYIIDGSASDATEFGTLSAEDIESIEILKDAASQAIYGARASDGVILVTTKRGKAGKTEVSYNGYVGLQTLWRNFDFYSPEEYMMLRREAKAADKGLIDARELSVEEALEDNIMQSVWASGNYVDWEDLMLKNAVYHNHDVSIRGGSEKLRVASGINFFDQDGMVVTGSHYTKASLRLNVDYDVAKWISLGFNTSYALTKQDREDGNFTEYITRTPFAEVYDEDGNPTKQIDSEGHYNPLYRAQHYGREITRNNVRLNFFMDVKPFKGFNYRLNASLYNRLSEDGSYKDSEYPGGGSTASLTYDQRQNWVVENIFTYDVPIQNKNHRLNVTMVQSVDHTLTKSLGYSVDNLPIDKDWNFISNGEFTGKPERDYSENNLVSFMARVQYSLHDRYLFNLAIRRDGSSRFGTQHKWGTFPSAAFAWRINQEDFLRDVHWLDNLKLRVSYGIVGNQNGIDNYTTLGLADNESYEFGDDYQSGYLPGDELSNPNLKWEQSAMTNFGLEFGLFRGRLNGTVEYYDTRTSNLLVKRTLNASTGYVSMLDNLGKTKSSGWEVSLNGDVIRKKDFNWNIGLIYSRYKDEIVKIDDTLDENGNYASQPASNWIIGEPINIYYDYLIDGIWQYDDFEITRDEFDNLVYTQKPTIDTDGDGIADKVLDHGTVAPGMVKVHDANGDGVINADDRVPIKKDPDFTMSLTSTWSWKGVDLFMDWYGVYGRKIKNSYLYDSNDGGSLSGKLNGVKVNYWTPFNPSNEFPRPSYNSSATYQSAIAIEDASYIRLRTLQLGYTFPQQIVRKLRMSKLRVYATATNLLTFTKFRSYSPELTPGSYPESRQFVLGVNVTF